MKRTYEKIEEAVVVVFWLLFLAALSFGCNEKVPERPYIITGKMILFGSKNNCDYYFTSRDGKRIRFQEPCINYTIGDTILQTKL